MSTPTTAQLLHGVRLYYRLLKLHSKALPTSVTTFANLYVKSEFQQHHLSARAPQAQMAHPFFPSNRNNHVTTANEYQQFVAKWEEYEAMLAQKGFKQIARPLSKQEELKLSLEQKEALQTLKEGVNKI